MEKNKINNEIEAGKQVANCDDQLPETMDIQPLIRIIRGQQVMLDRDLATLYGVETGQLNRQVKRNIDRFPIDFMFQLTKKEYEDLKCQIGTSSWGGDRRTPHAFTENGVAMLSGVLRSQIAIEVNIRIMRAFTSMRHFLTNNATVFQRLETIEYNQLKMRQHQSETDKRIDEVFRRLDAGTTKPRQGVFYDGQIYDAYAFVSDLVRSTKFQIVLIDNYVDETVLTLLDKRTSGVSATIYTQQINAQLQLDINRHNTQYPAIEVNIFKRSHDRFLCIDDDVYHIGASIKDLGKKWFAFSKMEDVTPAELIARINK